jgi:hypothetical protein
MPDGGWCVMHTHSPAEWAQMLSLAIALYSSASAPWFLLVDADLKDFDPRPALHRARQVAVYAARDLDRAVAATRHELAPQATAVRHAFYGGREMARDLAALLLLLTTTPKGALR